MARENGHQGRLVLVTTLLMLVTIQLSFPFRDENRLGRKGKHKRPERQGVQVFYDEVQAKKYATSSRMINIQTEMTRRALELLEIPLTNQTLLLDVGCGSGLSGSVISDYGVRWVGMDISPAMLGQAKDRGVDGDLVLADMGMKLPFRYGLFDAVIGISCLQWLFANERGIDPFPLLVRFFHSLRVCMTSQGRAVLQFYPENAEQSDIVTKAAKKAGLKGGVMIDDQEIKKKTKHYLCLAVGTKQSFMRQADVDRDKEKKHLRRKRVAAAAGQKLTSMDRIRQTNKKSRYSGRKRSKKFG